MPRTGVTREQVHQAAAALATEGANPTVQAVRTRLGGGSPNRITPWLAEWRAAQTSPQVDTLPEIPQAIDHAMRHLWALAWQQAQARLAPERQALDDAQTALKREREQVRAETRELKALAEGRQARLREQGAELEQARAAVLQYRKQLNGLPAERDRLREQVARLQAEAVREQETTRLAKQTLELGGKKISALEHALSEERQARRQAEQQLSELRIELATLRERASQQAQLTQLIETFRAQRIQHEHSNP